jgi:hypothetical protein
MTWGLTTVAALGGALALHAGPVHAHEGHPDTAAEPSGEGGAVPELRGRLEASPRRLFLELGGNALELTLDGASQRDEPRGGADPSGGHELRARVTVGNRTTHVALRLSIESERAAPDVPSPEPETTPPTR